MKKLLQLLDNGILKFLTGFLIAFIVLYPKLPSIGITHTWVYIRLEDFVIATTSIVWLIQVARKKVSLPLPLGWSLVLYWVIGLISLIYCFLFVAPHLLNFFPTVAALQYFRRIEYMILFFVGYSTVKSRKDIRDYLIVLGATLTAVVIYGLGQRYYVALWHLFPAFFEKNPFCFPAFLTGNEEFAKGTPFCLADTSRVAATFGGHYDLAAYLVFVIPIFISVFIAVKKWYVRIATFLIVTSSLIILNLTSSRTSFAAYLLGAIAALVFWKKKLWIIPVVMLSIGVLLTFKGETLARFLKTIQPVNVVSVKPNQELPKDLQKIIQHTKEVDENQTPEKPPPGTITLSTPATNQPVPQAQTVTSVLTDKELATLTDTNVEGAISTKSGAFLIQKAYALDISFTTRFQAEWPRDFAAFMSQPLLGTGYSSLTLASDNDYLRALGETGALGFVSFALIFIMLGIYLKKTARETDALTQALIFGFAGGVVGLLANAFLIDVFEASKVGESFWLLLGISVGAVGLQSRKDVGYLEGLKAFFTSKFLMMSYLLLTTFVVFGNILTNFFIADDFTWLKWAATSTFSDIPKYFLNAQGFFYRPIDKTVMFFLYLFFSFQPVGYHFFSLLLYATTAMGVYCLALRIMRHKGYSLLTAVVFLLLPMHFENVFWISTISHNLLSVCIVWGIVAFIRFRETMSLRRYGLVLLLAVLGILSYEQGMIFPLLLLSTDVFLFHRKVNKKDIAMYLPFVVIDAVYLLARQLAHVAPVAGDYSYSLPHFIPNLVGNFFGYMSLFVFGPSALPWYTMVRLSTKPYSLLIIVITLVVVGLVGAFLFTRKYQLHKKISYPVAFGFAWIIVGLLPFLGLGNIAPRYGYIPSIGYCLLLVGLIHYLATKSKKMFQHGQPLLVLVATVGLLVFFITQIQGETRQWQQASSTTRKTFSFFFSHHPTVAPGTQLLFVNVPIRKGDTWIFPVGLQDALWFMYHDDTLTMYQLATVKQAQDLKRILNAQGKTSYLFQFNHEDTISEIK